MWIASLTLYWIGPEIIDKKLITCDRVVNQKLGTVDFLAKGQTKIPGVTNLVFRTHPELEKSKLIFQMGTANPDIAVDAAKVIINDVSGIDVNAGCPKHFSIHGGMGAALLKTPDILESILINLVEKIGKPNQKPISVKIRLLPEENDTLVLVERLLKTGISNLTVHCRTQPMRNREQPIRDYIDKIRDKCKEHNVTFIINGMVLDRADFNKLQKIYGEDVGGMIATEAEANPTCFNLEPLKWPKLLKEYIEIAQKYDNFFSNSKYMLTRMTPGRSFMYQLLARTKNYEDVIKVLEKVNEDGTEKKETKLETSKVEKKQVVEENNETKKHKLDSENEIQESIPEKKQHLEQVSA